MKLSILLMISFLFLSACGGSNSGSSNSSRETPQEETSTPNPNAGKVSLWIRSGGYDAAVFLPADYGTDPNAKYPMVLSLHGFNGSVLNDDHTEVGGDRTGFIKQVWETPLAQSFPGIVIAPDVYPADRDENRLWNHNRLKDLIKDALAVYQVDPDKITITGHSAGSLAAQEFALRDKDLIAGIMPGAFDTIMKVNSCSVEDLPIWAFGNSSDVIFQPASWKSFSFNIQDCPNYVGTFTLTIEENDCGHDCWDQHWERSDVQEWLVNQSN